MKTKRFNGTIRISENYVRYIAIEPKNGKSLKDKLMGLKSSRISRFRIIYRIPAKRTIDIDAYGPRKTTTKKPIESLKKEAHQ